MVRVDDLRLIKCKKDVGKTKCGGRMKGLHLCGSGGCLTQIGSKLAYLGQAIDMINQSMQVLPGKYEEPAPAPVQGH
jgi:hypothetical protein